MLSPHSVPALLQVLQNPHESDMVRHEAAEALGGIATPEVLPYLKEYMTREDAPVVVKESCQVALDMYEVGSHLSLGLRPVLSVCMCLFAVRKF
jgi:deoxyhypusine monooxygenase